MASRTVLRENAFQELVVGQFVQLEYPLKEGSRRTTPLIKGKVEMLRPAQDIILIKGEGYSSCKSADIMGNIQIIE